jgi:hypothetical protein
MARVHKAHTQIFHPKFSNYAMYPYYEIPLNPTRELSSVNVADE